MSNRWDNPDKVTKLINDMEEFSLSLKVGSCGLRVLQADPLMAASIRLAGETLKLIEYPCHGVTTTDKASSRPVNRPKV